MAPSNGDQVRAGTGGPAEGTPRRRRGDERAHCAEKTMGGDGWQVGTGVQDEAGSGDAGLGCSSPLAVIQGAADPPTLVRRGTSRDNAKPATDDVKLLHGDGRAVARQLSTATTTTASGVSQSHRGNRGNGPSQHGVGPSAVYTILGGKWCE